MTDPISPSERLKRLHDAQMTAARIKYLRLRELRGWLMTNAGMREHRRIEREDEKDREDERNGDWSR